MTKRMQSGPIRLERKDVKHGRVWYAWKNFVAAHWRPLRPATDVFDRGERLHPQRSNWDEC